MYHLLVLAQHVDKVKDPVPADIFNWIIGAACIIIVALATVVVFLYRSKSTGLTPEQAQILLEIRDVLAPALAKLEQEQKERREDIERLMNEQKDVFMKGLTLTGKITPLMDDLRQLLARVEDALTEE